MRCQIIIAVVAVTVLLGSSPQVGGKSDQDALQGVWHVAGGEMDGKALPPEMAKEITLTVKGNAMYYKHGANEDSGTFKLDESKKPKHIDITDKKDGTVMKGIYELKGDEFKMCLDPDGKERPTEFKSKENSKVGVVIFKREKK